MEILRFPHDLRDTKGLALPKKRDASAHATPREIALAEELIESMRSDWEPEKYRDQFHDDVLALIEKKAKTGKVDAPPRREAPRTNVVDLMALLQKSVKERQGGRAAAEGSAAGAKRSSAKGSAKPKREGPASAESRPTSTTGAHRQRRGRAEAA
jgi:DNA end-binding protein Ku